MIRTNLSTRPFYNERAVRVWLAAVAVLVVLAATLFNVVAGRCATRDSDTELATQASQRRGARRRPAAAAPRDCAPASIPRRSSSRLDGRAPGQRSDRSPHVLLDRAVQPLRSDAARRRADHRGPADARPRRRHRAHHQRVARSVDDVNQFMENLEQTGAFMDLHSREEQTTDDGPIESALEMIYQPATAARRGGRPGQDAPKPARHREVGDDALAQRIFAENRGRRSFSLALRCS